MARSLAFVALLVLSTLAMGAGEPSVEPDSRYSSPREDEGHLLNDRGVILLETGRIDQAIDLPKLSPAIRVWHSLITIAATPTSFARSPNAPLATTLTQ
jgi:hypothetical protein